MGIEMPTISMFYGILVSLLFEDNDRHHLPHIHVRYQGVVKRPLRLKMGDCSQEIFHLNN
jgi:hypothetical protein